MEISRQSLTRGVNKSIMYDVFTLVIVFAGLLAAFAWNLGPSVVPDLFSNTLIHGGSVLLIALFLMHSLPE